MKRFGKAFSLLVLLCAATMGAGYAAQKEAQDFPRRPIRVVIPFAPGGATDIVARQIGPALGELLGQPLVVDNRPGAAGNIGVELVARAQPDGYTVLLGNVSTSSINPLLFASKLQVKPDKDLAGVTLLVSVPNLIVSGRVSRPGISRSWSSTRRRARASSTTPIPWARIHTSTCWISPSARASRW